ncbi:exodeoxyribonuclease VII large subunit [Gluconobacter sphaericus]|uniref:exodeoxyribonuclease VII large subunit n=1 Tax=Gluconobacter sphaericus TaxID=574987 RepID=UPI001B8D600A|nr:exodeoxyribonuclease VII large subunit [Gluconobacter sphaericus]MBS1085938.1 exodeoxyribonuclease VII large subunit [Gluconobacter sphaericus]MBS1099666.1 exodeoxyribonuclease VII large subunit [Gluconobacter sphaericus]
MDAFPRRSRSSSAAGDTTTLTVLSPLQVQDLFSARLDEICAAFDEWGFPLIVAGQLGDAAPNAYPKYYQLPLTDPQFGTTLALEVQKSILARAEVGPGDYVHVTGMLRARQYRGQVVLRFEVVAVELHDPDRQKIERVERSVLDVLRGLPCAFHPYPTRPEARLLLIHSAASSALVAEDFLQALGGAWRPERVRSLPTAMNDPSRLAEAIRTCREDIIVLIRGGGDVSDFVVFENPLVLEVLAACPAHRVLGLGHTANRTLAERVVDHAATTPADAGHYIRRMSGRVWQEQEEARAQQEEMAALRDSVTQTVVPERTPIGTRLRNGLILFAIGVALGLLLTWLL